MNEFDDDYAEAQDFFGSEPEKCLLQFVDRLDTSLPILDVGCGQGRNAIALAKRGFQMLAIDPSEVAVQSTRESAALAGLPVSAHRMDFTDLDERRVNDWTGHSRFGAVLLFGIIQVLRWSEIHLLADRCTQWLRSDGLVFVTAFMREDPSFARIQAEWRRIDRNSFVEPENEQVRTFLEPDEITRLFDRFEPIHHWEGTGPTHRHGTGPLHHHAMIEFIGRRR